MNAFSTQSCTAVQYTLWQSVIATYVRTYTCHKVDIIHLKNVNVMAFFTVGISCTYCLRTYIRILLVQKAFMSEASSSVICCIHTYVRTYMYVLMLMASYCTYVRMYGTCHNKVSVERPYERPFPFLRYARTRTCRTPVCVVIERPYHLYARRKTTPVFVRRRISTRRCESFGMFASDRSVTLALRVFVRAAAVSFSECSSQLVLLRIEHSDYVLRGNRTPLVLIREYRSNSLVPRPLSPPPFLSSTQWRKMAGGRVGLVYETIVSTQ